MTNADHWGSPLEPPTSGSWFQKHTTTPHNSLVDADGMTRRGLVLVGVRLGGGERFLAIISKIKEDEN